MVLPNVRSVVKSLACTSICLVMFSAIYFRGHDGKAKMTPVSPQVKKEVTEGYFVAQRFSDQLTAGVQNILSLQCLASKIGEVAVIEPVLVSSYYGINVHTIQGHGNLKFGDLHDIVKWNHYTTTLNYSPLVSVENFKETVHRNKVQNLILVEYNCKKGSKPVLNDGLAFGKMFGLKLVNHICFDFSKTVELSHFKGRLYSGYEPNEVVVLFSQYGGIYGVEPDMTHKVHRVYISGTGCHAGSNDLVFSGLFPSTSVMSDAEQYIYKYMNGTQNYISVMVRIEKSLIHTNKTGQKKVVFGAMNCVHNVIMEWRKAQNYYGIRRTFLTTDVGRFGSSSLRRRMEGDALLKVTEYLYFVIHGGTLSLSEWEQRFTTIGMGQTKSSAYIAMMQKVVSAKGAVLITAGGKSTFHQNTQNLHRQFHRDPKVIHLGDDCS